MGFGAVEVMGVKTSGVVSIVSVVGVVDSGVVGSGVECVEDIIAYGTLLNFDRGNPRSRCASDKLNPSRTAFLK
jgi:hypothetical protein